MTSFNEFFKWDAFISHASEDKDAFVRPLADGLKKRGLSVWFDECELKVGDSLRESIDRGLKRSRFGIVVISPHFFKKQWPQNELNGLTTRETGGTKVILPVWHNVDVEAVRTVSPVLADRVATSSSKSLKLVIEALVQAIAPPAKAVGSSTPARARPTTPQRTTASSKAVQEIADRIRKKVESLANSGEKWTVNDNPSIAVFLANPKNPNQGRGAKIDASNFDKLGSVMERLRSEWEAQASEEEEYEKELLKIFKSET